MLILIFSYASCASAAQPNPRERAQVFLDSEFPLAELAEWSSREAGYVVSFYDEAALQSVEIVFDRRGRWEQMTLSLDEEKLSPIITGYLAANFQQYYLTAFEMRYRKKNRQVGLVIDTPEIIYTLLFDDEGKLVDRYEEGIDG